MTMGFALFKSSSELVKPPMVPIAVVAEIPAVRVGMVVAVS